MADSSFGFGFGFGLGAAAGEIYSEPATRVVASRSAQPTRDASNRMHREDERCHLSSSRDLDKLFCLLPPGRGTGDDEKRTAQTQNGCEQCCLFLLLGLGYVFIGPLTVHV
jgi:hypothetical protein